MPFYEVTLTRRAILVYGRTHLDRPSADRDAARLERMAAAWKRDASAYRVRVTEYGR